MTGHCLIDDLQLVWKNLESNRTKTRELNHLTVLYGKIAFHERRWMVIQPSEEHIGCRATELSRRTANE